MLTIIGVVSWADVFGWIIMYAFLFYSRSASADGSGSLSSPERESLPVIREGVLTCKFIEIDGKVKTIIICFLSLFSKISTNSYDGKWGKLCLENEKNK